MAALKYIARIHALRREVKQRRISDYRDGYMDALLACEEIAIEVFDLDIDPEEF